MGKVNQEDIKMMDAIIKTNINNPTGKLLILVARPYSSAQGNKFRGGGFEDERTYTNCQLVFCDIQNIHAVTKAHNELQNIPMRSSNFSKILTYGSAVNSSKYMAHISTILKGTNAILDSILNKNQNVLVHCSDGWDRTSQLCALA